MSAEAVIRGAMKTEPGPLSERVLATLPPPRALWIGFWALIPWLNALANLALGPERRTAVWEQSDVVVVLNYAALSFACGFTLWGTGHLVRRAEALRATMSTQLDAGGSGSLRGRSSVVGPLVLSAGGALVFASSALVRDGGTPAAIRAATWLLVGIPIWSFLWTYASLLIGLNRIGRQRLLPDTVSVDPGFGLQPLGRIASTGLWMLLIWLVPALLTGLPDVLGVVLGLLVLGTALLTFFLSLLGLHRQMVAAKQEELSLARTLYAKAYEPVRAAPTLETLEEQRSLLGAADALEKRAGALHEWPIDEGTSARVIAITTSVIAMTIGRVILNPFGL